MEIITIISNFITQYIPDFSTHIVEYFLLALLICCVVGVIRR